jgi:hypothetical protein
VILRNIFICTKLWYEYKVVRIEVLILKKLLIFEYFWCCLCVVHGRRMVRLA